MYHNFVWTYLYSPNYGLIILPERSFILVSGLNNLEPLLCRKILSNTSNYEILIPTSLIIFAASTANIRPNIVRLESLAADMNYFS